MFHVHIVEQSQYGISYKHETITLNYLMINIYRACLLKFCIAMYYSTIFDAYTNKILK